MRGGGYRGRGTPPVPSSDEDAEVGAEIGERGGRGAPDAAGAAEHEHAGGPRGVGRPLHLGGSVVPGGGCGGRRRACSDHAHGGHSVGLSPRQAAARSDGDVRCGEALLERWTCQVCGR